MHLCLRFHTTWQHNNATHTACKLPASVLPPRSKANGSGTNSILDQSKMKIARDRRKGIGSVEAFRAIDQSTSASIEGGLNGFMPKKRTLDLDPVDLEAEGPPSKRMKQCVTSDRNSADLVGYYWALYNKGLRGLHRSDPLHNMTNETWRAVGQSGMTSMGPSLHIMLGGPQL